MTRFHPSSRTSNQPSCRVAFALLMNEIVASSGERIRPPSTGGPPVLRRVASATYLSSQLRVTVSAASTYAGSVPASSSPSSSSPSSSSPSSSPELPPALPPPSSPPLLPALSAPKSTRIAQGRSLKRQSDGAPTDLSKVPLKSTHTASP